MVDLIVVDFADQLYIVYLNCFYFIHRNLLEVKLVEHACYFYLNYYHEK